jgi:predicted nucleic acid-binding protein
VIRWVVDASVALKWCLPAQNEMFVPEAELLLASYRRGTAQFLVPDLFWPELGNALWKGVWKQTINRAWAEKAYAKVEELDIPTIPCSEFVPKALQLAVSHGRTVYDSLYVVLAMHSQADLITADERLANALAARFPVKWLGAF